MADKSATRPIATSIEFTNDAVLWPAVRLERSFCQFSNVVCSLTRSFPMLTALPEALILTPGFCSLGFVNNSSTVLFSIEFQDVKVARLVFTTSSFALARANLASSTLMSLLLAAAKAAS